MTLTYRRTVGLLVAILLAGSSAHLGAASCKTTEGSFTAILLPAEDCASPVGLCTLGTLNGKSPETYSFVMDDLVVINESQLTYTGHSVITRMHGGGTLFGEDTGIMNGVTGEFVTTVNIVGGTKQFKNATGQYVATGQIDYFTQTVTGTYTSTVCQ